MAGTAGPPHIMEDETMTKKQEALGLLCWDIEEGVKNGNFLRNKHAFLAKLSTLKKGEYIGIEVLKKWMPEMAEYDASMKIKHEEAIPYFHFAAISFPKYFGYSNTHGLDMLTIRK